ncbi:hypothetical protein [Neisseria sp. Ec49-e6-T10]|uniref:hypothetical protein n=1 Tax=Neisseria sp. Ec49-e6-T10 TaxID=3140744 RepID=UPI003EB7AAD1
MFKDGAGRIQLQDRYERFGLAQVDGTSSVFPKSDAEAVLRLNRSEMESYLGVPKEHLDRNNVLHIDIEYKDSLSLRVPTGNEIGANSQWIPDGKLPEDGRAAVIDAKSLVENQDYKI